MMNIRVVEGEKVTKKRETAGKYLEGDCEERARFESDDYVERVSELGMPGGLLHATLPNSAHLVR